VQLLLNQKARALASRAARRAFLAVASCGACRWHQHYATAGNLMDQRPLTVIFMHSVFSLTVQATTG
jgi:hypothetical protein